jgi:hypothetical protein
VDGNLEVARGDLLQSRQAGRKRTVTGMEGG